MAWAWSALHRLVCLNPWSLSDGSIVWRGCGALERLYRLLPIMIFCSAMVWEAATTCFHCQRLSFPPPCPPYCALPAMSPPPCPLHQNKLNKSQAKINTSFSRCFCKIFSFVTLKKKSDKENWCPRSGIVAIMVDFQNLLYIIWASRYQYENGQIT